jgi:O-antigen/teichoic acid export membrane protein
MFLFNRLLSSQVPEQPLLKKSAIVASGQLCGYALALAASPFLSRLYHPVDFGLLAIFVTLMTVLGSIATFRYDYAIPLPKDDRSAATLAFLSKWMAALVTVGLFIAAAFFAETIEQTVFRAQHSSFSFSYLLAVGVAAFASCEIHSAWLVRQGKYVQLSRVRLCHAVACLTTQLTIPILWNRGPLGLLAGQVTGYAAASAIVFLTEGRHTSLTRHTDFREIWRTAAEYRMYPLIDVWSSVVRVLSVNSLALLIAWAYGPAAAGCLALAQRLVSTPISMLSYSISRVYYSEAAVLARVDSSALKALFTGTLKRLTLLTAVPLAIVCVLAPWTFGIIFGARWESAGIHCSLLCPLILLRVLAFAVGPTLDVIHRQELRLFRESTGLLLVAAGVGIACWLGWGVLAAVAAAVAFGCFGYVLSIALTWRALIAHHRYFLTANGISGVCGIDRQMEAA